MFGALLLAACFGSSPLPDGGADAAYGRSPDLAPLCRGDNDGQIARSEIAFPLGLRVNYLVNPPGTTVPVHPDGTPRPGGPEWDLTSTAGEVRALAIEPLAGQWFEAKFPGATYATVTDLGSGTLGVFRVTDDALWLLGFVSRDPDRTLLIYEQPVATLRFPVRLGDGWVTGSRITKGTLDGAPFASTDTYRISVDARGTAVLPFLSFTNTLRVHVELTQAVFGGASVSRVQQLLFHECHGELGRMVSSPGDTDPSFTTAAEFRRLAL
ncbi:MAG: hypothetical protein EXR72_22330 [Myxococcales bacterium]|nr:hypothetical protein [Myxococcales bacterium]